MRHSHAHEPGNISPATKTKLLIDARLRQRNTKYVRPAKYVGDTQSIRESFGKSTAALINIRLLREVRVRQETGDAGTF